MTWKNSFPPKDDVHKTLLPRTLVTSKTIAYGPMTILSFGSYVQTSVEENITMRAQTVGGVVLRPTGNIQGGVRFLTLTTGRVMSARKWQALPVTRDVISRVHQLVRRAKAGRKWA